MSWEENVRKVVPYTPGEQPDRENTVKLNTNECPYPPAPGVRKVLESMDYTKLRLYPDPKITGLTQCLADRYQVDPERIFVGVGSDDVLAMAFLTFFQSDKPILFPDITYSFYDVWADLYRIPYRTCPLDENFRMVKEDYYRENGGIIFPNPNAPTSILEPLDTVEDILIHNPGVVVIVDEAYIDFGGVSCLPLLEKYDNLLVVQTFSKSRAMAGARIGFAIGSPEMIRYLNDVKFSFNSYTVNYPSQLIGMESVKDEEYFRGTAEKIVRTRERTEKKLRELGFSFPDSRANFLFVTHKDISAEELFTALKEQNIYVRYWKKPRISDYLRISIGTDREMDILIEFLKEYIAKVEKKND